MTAADPSSSAAGSPGAETGISITSTALLAGLRDPAAQHYWQQYVDRYRPLILRYASRVGLSSHDAEDVTQASLMDFCAEYRAGRYDRSRGRLRQWLFGIVRNRIRACRKASRRDLPLLDETGSELPGRLVAPDELEGVWDAEWRETIVELCLRQVRGEVEAVTYAAFQQFAVQGRAAEDVGRELHLSVNAVYGAKRRILRRLTELRPLFDEAW